MHAARNEVHYDACGFNVTTHGTEAMTQGLCIFPKQTRQCGSVKIYLDRQLILASMVRDYYLRVK